MMNILGPYIYIFIYYRAIYIVKDGTAVINANTLRNHIVLSQNTASIDYHNSKLNCQDANIQK